MGDELPAQLFMQMFGKLDAVTLDDEIDVFIRTPQQNVADNPADQIHFRLCPGSDFAYLLQQRIDFLRQLFFHVIFHIRFQLPVHVVRRFVAQILFMDFFDDVGPCDDADQFAVFYDRQAADIMFDDDFLDLFERHVRMNRNDVRRHVRFYRRVP